MFIRGKSGSFSDFEFSLREIFITDGSDRVCTLLEIYHLFSRGYIWAAHTVLCTWKSIRLSDWSNQPSLRLAGPTRWWELAGQTQVTHIYAGGHDSYSSVQVRLRVIRPDNQTCTLWVTMIRQAREAVFEIARFSNRKKKTSACSFG